MSATMPFLLMLGLQLVAGYATLGAMRLEMHRSMSIPVSILVGTFLHSLVFFGCELLHIPLSTQSMLISAFLVAIIPHLWWKNVTTFYGRLLTKPTWTLTLYDVVTLGVVGYVTFIAVWASWYWPVTPFDAMAGIDLVAKQTVEEGTIVNRVFTDPSLAGHLSNQPFYAPFSMLLQVMYRLIGFAYGQVWVSIIAISLGWIVWLTLRQYVHPFIADLLLVLYVLTPEMLGYSYIVQTDLINAAYFAGGAIFMWHAISKQQKPYLWLSMILLCGACWSRSESILLVGIGLIGSITFIAKNWSWRFALTYIVIAGMSCLVVFGLWHVLFFNTYLPVHPSTAEQIIGFDVQRLVHVVSSSFTTVVFDTALWAATFVLFGVVLVVNLFVSRSASPILPLVWIGATFLGLWIVGTVFSAAIVEQTLRRGIFKVIPLIFVYVAGTELLQRASRRLMQWEAGRPS
ncbi:MAG: hypothetical protein H7X70_05500 [Candidatus Kapabacteria bacterium]|nr:hypothetical protein [Candidatus Kapabacteria bacterium]